jgi:acyl-homoserine lactone acylase PvdQ
MSVIEDFQVGAGGKGSSKREKEAVEGKAIPLIPSGNVKPPLSNLWVVHGNYTQTGKPVLAADLHFEKQMPGVFYLAGLRFSADEELVGGTIVGVPAVVRAK